MSTWGGRLNRASTTLRDKGERQSVAPQDMPEYTSVKYTSWLLGMVASVSPENTPENAGRDVMDILIERDDSLTRAPGVTESEDVTPRSLRWLFEHNSPNYNTELVAIDAPYLGAKNSGAFVFADAGINAPGVNGWNAVNIFGIFLFSDGSASTYYREFGDMTVTDISADIIARTFANAFGRTFAGAYTDPVDGLVGLGIRWNGTSGDVDDWAGAGSGEELLISNSLEADKVVAIRPMGFDAMAILCRKSLWIGYPTQQADRPADFRIRINGIGCVAEPTASLTPDGVTFLSDEGVVSYNQNEHKIISEDINSELLPIDYTQLTRYKSVYMPKRQLYILQTPVCTWFYEFPHKASNGVLLHPGRWTRRSFAFDTMAIFTDQSGNVYWATAQGSWDSQTLTWNEMVQSQDDAPPHLYLAEGSILGVEDPAAEDYLGEDQDVTWETRQVVQEEVSEQISTLGYELEYISTGPCDIEILMPDSNGDFTQRVTKTLSNSNGKRRRGLFWHATTGQGAKMQFKIVSGNLKLYRIRQIIQDSGPQLSALT